jgi:hypothetical protein
VLASFGDTGAESLRLRYPDIPILGIAEAAFAAARQIGGRFAIVTFAPEVVPSLRIMAERHGMAESLMRIAAVPRPLSHDPAEVADLLCDELRDLCLASVSEGHRLHHPWWRAACRARRTSRTQLPRSAHRWNAGSNRATPVTRGSPHAPIARLQKAALD